MDNGSSSEINFSVRGPRPNSTRAKAKHIRRLSRHVLWDLDHSFDIAKRWDSLTPVQKIQLEQYSTDKLLELLELYNHHVSHSIHYRLREKTPEEEEEEEED